MATRCLCEAVTGPLKQISNRSRACNRPVDFYLCRKTHYIPTLLQDFNMDLILYVMETLLSVVYRRFQKLLCDRVLTDESAHLNHLLCSLQTSLLSWCYQRMGSAEQDERNMAQAIISRCRWNLEFCFSSLFLLFIAVKS